MTRTRVIFAALALACLLPGGAVAAGAPAPGAAATEASARAYVQGLYNRYEHDTDFGVLGDNEAEFFDSSTAALLQENTRLLNGELGGLDRDPLCACQDPSGMKADIQSVHMTGATTASAVVAVAFGDRSSAITRLRVDVALANGQCRILDVRKDDTASLRETLIKENRELSAPARH